MAGGGVMDKHAPLWNRSAMTTSHETALAALARKGRLRKLVPRAGLDFTSNDYLGLAESQALRDAAAAAQARGEAEGGRGNGQRRGRKPAPEAPCALPQVCSEITLVRPS